MPTVKHEPADVLQLGNPLLRKRSQEVTGLKAEEFLAHAHRLEATLSAFRTRYGFGRAIAAPQIGVPRRFLALDLGTPELIINPQITWRSEETFTLWDDCMSFPFLLVKLERHASISVTFKDREGREQEWNNLDRATSELLQHEIDHLDGILAVDRALDRDSLVARETFEGNPAHFAAQVDGLKS
jgi:peptide deformylase